MAIQEPQSGGNFCRNQQIKVFSPNEAVIDSRPVGAKPQPLRIATDIAVARRLRACLGFGA
jgi:hypothetical protein